MSVLTLALCAWLSWLLVSFYVHVKSLHIIIIIIIIIIIRIKQSVWIVILSQLGENKLWRNE